MCGLAGAALAIIGVTVAGQWQPAEAANIGEVFSRFTPGSAETVNHSVWDKLLKAYVTPGDDGLNRVAYARFKKESHDQLKRYVAALEAVHIKALDRSEQFAFWANLYNAKTVDVVLDHYPVNSITDINLGGGLLVALTGGPWKAKVVKVGGHELSLDNIEHDILRPVFKDPRVHYAVNCASFSCPNLRREAFAGAKLDVQLDAAAKAYVNSLRAIRVESGKVTASSIYSWYSVDFQGFGGTERGVLEHLRRYAEPELKRKLKSVTRIDSYEYDWALNDAKL
jgi:hypothetical protein